MKFERLLITCGGTGGHFYPGLAIARAMQKRGGEVKLLLAGVHAENQAKIALDQGVGSLILPVVPVPKKSPVRFLVGLVRGFFICRKEIKTFKPQALLGMGNGAMSDADPPAQLPVLGFSLDLYPHSHLPPSLCLPAALPTYTCCVFFGKCCPLSRPQTSFALFLKS